MTSDDAKAAPTGGVKPIGQPRISGRRRTTSAAALWMLAVSPVIWLMCSGVFVLRARVALGRWPRPYEPDPKDVGYLHYMALQAGIPLMWALSLTCAVVAAVRFRQLVNEGARPLGALAMLAACVATVLGLAQLDPGHLFTWLGD